jgi:hypothetical protein
MSDANDPAPSVRAADPQPVAPAPVVAPVAPVADPVPAPSEADQIRLAGIRGELAPARTAAETLRAQVTNLPDVLDDVGGDSRHTARLNLRRQWADAEARYEGLTLSEQAETREATEAAARVAQAAETARRAAADEAIRTADLAGADRAE